MSVTPTFHTDRWRVNLAGFDRADGNVLVERSFNELIWETVRGGKNVPVASGGFSLDDYEYTPGVVANHYRVTPVDPPAGLLLDGSSGGFASTPDTAVLDITADLDVRFDATLDDWNATAALVTKFISAGNQRSFYCEVNNTGQLQLRWTEDGTTGTQGLEVCGTDHAPFAVNGRLAVRYTLNDNDGGVYRVNFYVAPTAAGPWTQIDSNTGAATTSIFSSNQALHIGADGGGSNNPVGTIHAVEVYDGIAEFGGTLVADPDFAVQANRDASFADDAGRTWTVNGDAEVVGVDTTSITVTQHTGIVLKSLRYVVVNREVTVTDFTDPQRASRDGLFDVKGRSLPVGVHDLRGSQQFTLELMTTTAEQARDMDLILALGGTLLVHTPPNCPVPGGYVAIADTSQARRTRSGRSGRRYFNLPCTVEAAPGPEVTPTTLLWSTVRNTYGSWTALRAANPTWPDLYQSVGSLDDAVVL